MHLQLLAVLAAFISVTEADDGSAPYKVVCYYGSWAVYRPGQGQFGVDRIDPFLCTHLIYGFAGLDESLWAIKSLDPWNDLPDGGGKDSFRRFTNLKLTNPGLKTILAVGGWNEGSEKYSTMSADSVKRKTFIGSCVQFVKKFNFDGLDLDWEYPAERGGNPIDKDDYVKLIQEMKVAFEPEGLLLSAALGPGKATIDDSYHLKELAKYLDIFNVMAYDYHGAWDPFTGNVAPMYISPLDVQHDAGYEYFSVNFTMHYYISGGVPPSQMVMGIPLYGHGFTLQDPQQHGLYAPTVGAQPSCPYTRQAGSCGFNEICVDIKNGGWTTVRDPDQKAVYSYKDRIWIGYDDLESVKIKTDFIKSLGLAGGMVWSIETDDFHNLCGYGTANPLLTVLWTNLNGDIPDPSGPTRPPPPTGPATTSQPLTTPGDHICKHDGFNPDPTKVCSPIFYECVKEGDHWTVTQEECPNGLVFSESDQTCVWRSQAPWCDQ